MNVDKDNNSITVEINQGVYPLDSVYGASYTFIDRAYMRLDKKGKDEILVTITGKTETSAEDLHALGGEFLNELLNETLRLEISKKNKTIREMLINKALFATLPGEEDKVDDFDDDFLDEDLEFLDDPLGIAVPWEEKYASKDGDTKEEAPPPESKG
jgi:His-Xaa-Ser system protein HxsD